MGDNTEMGTLAVIEELHAKQQEAARKEAAARKAPQDAAADAKRPKGSAARSSRPPGRAAQRADLVTELDGTPVRDAAAQAGADGSAKSPNSPCRAPAAR